MDEADLEYTTPWFIDVLAEDRDRLVQFLKENNIGTRTMYPPVNKQLAYQTQGEYPVANLVGKKGLWLPSAAQLADEQIEKVAKTIKSFYSR